MFLTPQVRQQFFDDSGIALASGKIYTYLAGTTTPANTYTDAGGLTANANPIILDSSGSADIWIGPQALKFVIKDSSDATVKTVDNITYLPITTAGDIIYGGASGVATRLAKGAAGTVLQMGASYPQWAANPDLTTAAAKTSNYTILVSDDFVRFDATSGALTATFPSATTSTNKVIIVQKTDSSFNAVTMSGTGLTTNKLMTVGESVAYVSDGTNWVQLWRKTDTPWISYTMVITGTSANPSKATSPSRDFARWRRCGADLECTYTYYHTSNTGAAAGTGQYLFAIPNSSGWSIDNNSQLQDTNFQVACDGHGYGSSTATNDVRLTPLVYDTTRIGLRGVNETARYQIGSGAGDLGLTNATVAYSFTFRVPITDFQA